MPKLSDVYDVTVNLRGLAKKGYCRPGVSNKLSATPNYTPTWCGGGSPPDWFPPVDWEGYPIWIGDEGDKPNYDGPYKPKHPNIPWPDETLGADGVPIVANLWNNITNGALYWKNTSNGLWTGTAWQTYGPPEIILITSNTTIEPWRSGYRPTKVRVEFDNVQSVALSIRNFAGSAIYGQDATYYSGEELGLNCTADIGRLYLDHWSIGGTINITKIEFS